MTRTADGGSRYSHLSCGRTATLGTGSEEGQHRAKTTYKADGWIITSRLSLLDKKDNALPLVISPIDLASITFDVKNPTNIHRGLCVMLSNLRDGPLSRVYCRTPSRIQESVDLTFESCPVNPYILRRRATLLPATRHLSRELPRGRLIVKELGRKAVTAWTVSLQLP